MTVKVKTSRRFLYSFSPQVSGRAAPNKGFTRLKETSHFQIGHASSLGDEVGRWSWFTFPREGGGHGSLVTSSSMLHRHKKGGERSKPGHGDRSHLYTLHSLYTSGKGGRWHFKLPRKVTGGPAAAATTFLLLPIFPEKSWKRKVEKFFLQVSNIDIEVMVMVIL